MRFNRAFILLIILGAVMHCTPKTKVDIVHKTSSRLIEIEGVLEDANLTLFYSNRKFCEILKGDLLLDSTKFQSRLNQFRIVNTLNDSVRYLLEEIRSEFIFHLEKKNYVHFQPDTIRTSQLRNLEDSTLTIRFLKERFTLAEKPQIDRLSDKIHEICNNSFCIDEADFNSIWLNQKIVWPIDFISCLEKTENLLLTKINCFYTRNVPES